MIASPIASNVPSASREKLPSSMRFIERDWLSANMIVFNDQSVVDTGYFAHREMTSALATKALEGQALKRMINTHLHSDHCGGNAVLQRDYPQAETWVPQGTTADLLLWSTQAHPVESDGAENNSDSPEDVGKLTYRRTGQTCERFRFDKGFIHGDELELAGLQFKAIQTGGHDEDMLCLYCEKEALLISADALWEHGFGVMFAQFAGQDAITMKRATFDRLDQLDVRLVLPGHGGMFSDFRGAMQRARDRLAYFEQDPLRIFRNGAIVLLKFKLLEMQRLNKAEVTAALANANLTRSILDFIQARNTPADKSLSVEELALSCAEELVKRKAAAWNATGTVLENR